MIEDMTLQPRLSAVEREVHTAKYRLSTLEDTHKDTPHRLARVEQAVEDMPHIRKEITEQGNMIRKGFTLTNGILIGSAGFWFLYQAGPEIMKLLGAR